MITLTFAAHDHSDPSGFIHVSLLFGLCLVVIGLCLALMASGQECCRPLSVWKDNDERPAWPCLDGSSFPPPERGHSARLPLGSGVCQRAGIRRWSTREGQPSTTRGCSCDRRENDDRIIPMVLRPGLLFQGRGLYWTSTNNSQGKMRDWCFFCLFFWGLIIELIDAWKLTYALHSQTRCAGYKSKLLLFITKDTKIKRVWPVCIFQCVISCSSSWLIALLYCVSKITDQKPSFTC